MSGLRSHGTSATESTRIPAGRQGQRGDGGGGEVLGAGGGPGVHGAGAGGHRGPPALPAGEPHAPPAAVPPGAAARAGAAPRGVPAAAAVVLPGLRPRRSCRRAAGAPLPPSACLERHSRGRLASPNHLPRPPIIANLVTEYRWITRARCLLGAVSLIEFERGAGQRCCLLCAAGGGEGGV